MWHFHHVLINISELKYDYRSRKHVLATACVIWWNIEKICVRRALLHFKRFAPEHHSKWINVLWKGHVPTKHHLDSASRNESKTLPNSDIERNRHLLLFRRMDNNKNSIRTKDQINESKRISNTQMAHTHTQTRTECPEFKSKWKIKGFAQHVCCLLLDVGWSFSKKKSHSFTHNKDWSICDVCTNWFRSVWKWIVHVFSIQRKSISWKGKNVNSFQFHFHFTVAQR